MAGVDVLGALITFRLLEVRERANTVLDVSTTILGCGMAEPERDMGLDSEGGILRDPPPNGDGGTLK